MPRYDYECRCCGHREEHFFSMADMPSTVACEACGQESPRSISVPESFVRNREYVFNPAKCVRSNGRLVGRSDQQQHELYRKWFDGMRTRQRDLKRSHSKNKHEIQWIGGMPGEMADSIGEHEGDKEAVYKDPIPFLKKTGLYAGDD